MTEPAKKKQASFSSMFKNVPNKNEVSSSDSRPLLEINREVEDVMILKLI